MPAETKQSQEIYLDANATTPVLPQARAAALAAMAQDFGNPSSAHVSGLRARASVESVRARARHVLGANSGELVFVSGATEGIQTAVLSALKSLSRRTDVDCLLYGATEHKAVPEAMHHWNEVLGLGFEILAIPVDGQGGHDLEWLRRHASRAGLVCTMAANNETGVISDLEGIGAVLQDSPALWLVDCVQALGKLPLDLLHLCVDYAVFSGHKLYAPKGIGLMYVRAGVPVTPLIVGGGQEGALRSGTENLPGIAALGAVLEALEGDGSFRDQLTLKVFRDRLVAALRDAFPDLVLNAPESRCMPTTLNFSVPGLESRLLISTLDAAGVRVSGGSACSGSSSAGSHVLRAMGLPDWQVGSAVRLSFGPAVDTAFIDEACERIRWCGRLIRQHGLASVPEQEIRPLNGVKRYVVDGACSYLLVDADSRRCVVIDPQPELTQQLLHDIRCRGLDLMAALDTHRHEGHDSAARALRLACGMTDCGPMDARGWNAGRESLVLGRYRLDSLPVPGHTRDSMAYLWFDERDHLLATFVGDMLRPGALGRSDFTQSSPREYGDSVLRLYRAVGLDTVLLPAHDHDDDLAYNFRSESAAQPLLARLLAGEFHATEFAGQKTRLEAELAPRRHHAVARGTPTVRCGTPVSSEVPAAALPALLERHPDLTVVDVREPLEQRLGRGLPSLGAARREEVPLSMLANAMPGWLGPQAQRPLLFVCRSGHRSALAARALVRLGHCSSFSLAGGLALWPVASPLP